MYSRDLQIGISLGDRRIPSGGTYGVMVDVVGGCWWMLAMLAMLRVKW